MAGRIKGGEGTLIGNAGEFYVAAELLKRGVVAAASLDDQELVRRATAFDPNLLSAYEGLVVRGTADGIILVCTGDGKRGLLEDAERTPKVDRSVWADSSIPCQFTLKTETSARKRPTTQYSRPSYSRQLIATLDASNGTRADETATDPLAETGE